MLLYKKKLFEAMIQHGTISDMSEVSEHLDADFDELCKTFPDAKKIFASILEAKYADSLFDLERICMPNLAPIIEESDEDYEARLQHYVNHMYFLADSKTNKLSNKIQYLVCSNPFDPELDSLIDLPIIITTQQVVNNVLRGQQSSMIDIANYSEDDPIEVWIGKLLSAVYIQGAQDVEITSHPSSMRVRLHIHGSWSDWVGSLPILQRGSLMRSLCASAYPSLDYKQGTVHDFKIERRIHGIDTSWRASIVPAVLGDSVTLRILPQIGGVPSLEMLGYDEKAIYMFTKTAANRDGFIIVSGPTGSGKSTTLYSVESYLRDQRKKVFTIEDPVELMMSGIVQLQVSDDAEMEEQYRISFASGVRSSLRHKPDVLVIGETRDKDTAQAGVGASRTGHLTYTTLHTTNVKTSVKRMLDIGIDPVNLADTLTMVVSQHLTQKLCPYCKIVADDGTATRNMSGCHTCDQRGELGKTVIYEMAWLDDEAREGIVDGTFQDHFERLSKKGRYISKLDTLKRLVKEGIVDSTLLTNLDEDNVI